VCLLGWHERAAAVGEAKLRSSFKMAIAQRPAAAVNLALTFFTNGFVLGRGYKLVAHDESANIMATRRRVSTT
jgi:hypothetical protein